MAHPVQYILREPFFISSRLMPAVRVGDATIHMRADTIDDGQPRPARAMAYLIDGPGLHYDANDVSTPYLGQATIGGPTADGHGRRLLAGPVSHGADRDETSPRCPDAVYQWARRNQDEISMSWPTSSTRPPQRMPAADLWRAITHDPYQTPYGRWCAGQAIAHADRLATLNPQSGPATGLVVRDELWHETALAWYTMLTDRAEPAITSVCAVADRDTIATWLTTRHRTRTPELWPTSSHRPPTSTPTGVPCWASSN